MIPAEAVEAAARAIYERKFGPEGWEGLPDKPRKQYADEARFILEAAAPLILRDALARGWDAAVAAMVYPDGSKVEVAENSNPYRSDA